MIIPKKRKAEDNIACLFVKTNNEHNNQIRVLKAELKESANSTCQKIFSDAKSPCLWSTQYGEGQDFPDCWSFLSWLHTNYGTTVVNNGLTKRYPLGWKRIM